MISGNPLVPGVRDITKFTVFFTEIMSGLFKMKLLTEKECE